MKRQLLIRMLTILILSAASWTLILAEESPRIDVKDVPRISKEELKAKLSRKNMIAIDVRLPGQVEPGEPKIRGAVVENPRDVVNWMLKYPKDKTLVFYCA